MLNYLLYEWEIPRGAWHSTIHFVREHLLADIVIECASFAGGVIVNPTNLQGIHGEYTIQNESRCLTCFLRSGVCKLTIGGTDGGLNKLSPELKHLL